MLKHLSKPPIVEVICGIAFPALDVVDAVTVGPYWRERREEYPKRSIHRPLAGPTQGPVVTFGSSMGPLRVWMTSEDESRLIQLQPDRFYLNWRKKGGDYPRFSKDGGLLRQVLEEFDLFKSYLDREFGIQPEPQFVEVGKVDHFVEGEHWSGWDDLCALLPSLKDMLGAYEVSAPRLQLALEEGTASDNVRISLSVPPLQPKAVQPRSVRLESYAATPLSEGVSLDEAFRKANQVVNGVFENLVPAGEMKRFQKD